MKKLLCAIPFLLVLTLCGCQGAEGKCASLSLVYGAAAVLSLILLMACCKVVHENRPWFLLLFSSVLVVNIGYTLLSVSTGLEMALMANRLAYLGSVFLPLSMVMVILNVTNTRYPRWFHGFLGAVAILVFLIAASPGILDIYYKEVSFAVINGVSTLVKVYGPLHPIYLVYLVGYFTAMVVVIVRSCVKKTFDTPAHAMNLAFAVFVNIGVWFIEQLSKIDFEFLSISYIISELFLLGVHLVMVENKRLKDRLRQAESLQQFSASPSGALEMLENPLEDLTLDPARMETFVSGLQRLTPTEKAVYDAHIARVTTREILANLNIKENTLKYHNRNLYSKLGVSSRKELLEIYKQLKAAQAELQHPQ